MYGTTAESRLTHCSLSTLIVLNPLLVPRSSPEALHVRRRERPLLAKQGIMGEKWPVRFSRKNATSTLLSGSLTCCRSATWGRWLYFPSEGRHAQVFFAQKIRRLWPGLNPRSWVPEVSMLTTRPSKPLVSLIYLGLLHCNTNQCLRCRDLYKRCETLQMQRRWSYN
jgi:hypothetical protein